MKSQELSTHGAICQNLVWIRNDFMELRRFADYYAEHIEEDSIPETKNFHKAMERLEYLLGISLWEFENKKHP